MVYCLARLALMLCDKADVVLDSPSATEVVSDAREEPRENPPPPPVPPVEPEPELGADDGFLVGVDLGLDLAVPETLDNVRCMATFIIGPLLLCSPLPTESIRWLVLETAVVAVAVAVLIERPSPPRAPPSPVPIRPNPRVVSGPVFLDTEPDAG